MGNIKGSKRGKYILKVKNKGCFKKTVEKITANCLTCNKEFMFYPCYKNKKYCSVVCYHISTQGKKRPNHSIFMKKYAINNNIAEKNFKGRKQSETEKKNTSERMKKRWQDKNDILNSEQYRQSISDRNMILVKQGKGISEFNKGYARGRQGSYDINGKQMFFRSLWEVNYALYLDFLIKQKQIIKWEYEVDTFWFEKIRRGVRSYKPDFKVFTSDKDFEYHEVKGYMDDKSATKLKRMAKYYPNIKMVLIDSDVYKDLKRQLGRICGFYE